MYFGSQAAPAGKPCWGARMIVNHGHVDLLPDRQGVLNREDNANELEVLFHRLNQEGGLARLKLVIGELLATGDMRHDQPEDFIIFHEGLVMHANTNGSHGYCYVSAWVDDEEEGQ